MMIVDLPCLAVTSTHDAVIGGRKNYYDNYDNKAVATSLAYAEGLNTVTAAGTSVYLDRGVSKANSFSGAQAS